MLTKSPMDVLAVDFVGPLPLSNGFQYLFVVIDCYSRYPFAFPVKDQTVGNVIKCLKDIFSLFGFPDAILSDQGVQFESHEYKNFLAEFKIKKLRTNAYHPSSNGIVERFNGALKLNMKAYVVHKGLSFNQWSQSVNHCLFDYRTTPHSTTNCIPV